MKKMIIVTLAIVMLPTLAMAAQVRLTWTPNTEPDLAGYRIYQSDSAGVYVKATNKVADITSGPGVSKIATIEVTPEDGRTVYFVATAYDTAGNESAFSNEVIWTVPDGIPPKPPGFLQVFQQMADALSSIAKGGLRVVVTTE